MGASRIYRQTDGNSPPFNRSLSPAEAFARKKGAFCFNFAPRLYPHLSVLMQWEDERENLALKPGPEGKRNLEVMDVCLAYPGEG